MPVQQIKHNNDGKFYHIAIDIAKEGAQLFDLTPYVKGRVGDNNFGLLVDWYRQGMLMNVNGAYKPIIDGLVGNFSFDKNGNLKMDDDASPVHSEGKPEDCGPAGQVTYYFPEQMFPKEGIFKGYLGLIDNKGNRYSGVDIWFTVLAGNARMGIACDFYISELEKAIATAEEDLKNSKKTMQTVVDEFTSKMNDLTNRLETQATTDQAALDALEAKIKQDNLFTQAEADAFKKTIQNELDKIKNAVGDVSIYGAVGDGATDDTAALQKVIDAFKSSDKTRLTFHGTYKVSKAGEDDDKRSYAIKVDGLENKVVDLTNAKFVLDLTDDMPNVFSFLNCTDVTVVGGYAEASFKETEGHPLYYGAFIYGKSCTNLSVYRTHAHNMMYGVCLFNCSQGQVSGNRFTHNLVEYDRKFRPLSAILMHGAISYHVSGNDITGGLRDGDLSIFGGDCYANVVTANHLRGLAWEEAITVDGGARKTIVSNNIIEGGYNYGIDVKYNAEDTLVIGNTVEKCVVAITDRGGEINDKANVFQTVIHDNNIIFGGIPSTQGWGDHRQTGIGINNQYAADVKGNHLTLGRGYDVGYPIYGIMASQSNSAMDYVSQIDISNNFIEFKNGIDAAYQIAGKGSTALCLDTITHGNITNNDIKAPDGDLAVKLLGQSNTIKFSANHFITDGVPAIQYYGDAGCKNLIITDDNYFQSGNLTNAYMYQTTIDSKNQSFVINGKKFGSANANPFFFITSKFNNTVIIHVEMQHDYKGTFVVSSTYKLTIDIKNKMLVTPVDEHNSDVEISSINLSENMFGLCAKATRECPDITNQIYRVTVISSNTNGDNVYA